MAELGSFADLAGIAANTVEKPKPLPAGQYIAVITGPFKEHRSSQKKTLAARFPIKLQGAMDEEIQAKIAADPALTKALNRDFSIDFWITQDSLWRITGFAEGMGISSDLTVMEQLEAFAGMGTPFMVQGTVQEPTAEALAADPNATGFFRVDNPAPLPA